MTAERAGLRSVALFQTPVASDPVGPMLVTGVPTTFTREEMRQRDGDAFDLKDFHRRALDIGGVGLDTLRSAVLGEL